MNVAGSTGGKFPVINPIAECSSGTVELCGGVIPVAQGRLHGCSRQPRTRSLVSGDKRPLSPRSATAALRGRSRPRRRRRAGRRSCSDSRNATSSCSRRCSTACPSSSSGLLDPVHDRVLMDPESPGGPRRAEVLLEVNPDRRPQPARPCRCPTRSSRARSRRTGRPRPVGGQQRGQLSGAVSHDRAAAGRPQLADATSDARLLVRVGHAGEALAGRFRSRRGRPRPS